MIKDKDNVDSKIPSIDVRTAQTMCSSYIAELDAARCRAAGLSTNGKEIMLTTSYEKNLDGYESAVVERAARIQVILQRCDNPDSPLLESAREHIAYVSDTYGADRLFKTVGNIRADLEENAGTQLPMSKPMTAHAAGPLTVSLYDQKETTGSWGEKKIDYDFAGRTYEVPENVLPSIPRPSVIVVYMDHQLPQVSVEKSVEVTVGVQLKTGRKVSDYQMRKSLEALLNDREKQFDLQEIIEKQLLNS